MILLRINFIIQEEFKHFLKEDFLINKLWKKNYEIENKYSNSIIKGEQYTFEYIDKKIELYLPVFIKIYLI